MLKEFAGRANPSAPTERCEKCSAPLAREHQHLLDPADRKIACVCDACALLFDGPRAGRFCRVPRDARRLPDFQLSDAEWDDLLIPINVAFLFKSSVAEKTVAIYPSPAGPMESLLTLDAWRGIVDHNPALAAMRPDVEALLINRLGARRGFDGRQYFIAPMDQCYRLVGLVRAYWRGLSGGEEAWRQIAGFFGALSERAIIDRTNEASHAKA